MIVCHQKINRKPMKLSHMGKNIKCLHPRVILYKKFDEKPFSFWRIINPLNLASIFFPLLILSNLKFNSFKTIEDYNLLPYAYLDAIFERLQIWNTCAREKVFLI